MHKIILTIVFACVNLSSLYSYTFKDYENDSEKRNNKFKEYNENLRKEADEARKERLIWEQKGGKYDR